MIVRDVESTTGTARHVTGDGWDSKRLIVASDMVGFSVHDTTVAEGSELELQYRHHVEANYCFGGEGAVFDLTSGHIYRLYPGAIYVLDQHYHHTLRPFTGILQLLLV